MVLRELLNNMLALVVLSYLYSLLYRYKGKTSNLIYNILSGTLFGFMAMLVIYSPFLLAPGVRIDGRSIILANAGLFGGIPAAIPAVLISSIFRLLLGGIGALTGVGIILSSAITGVLYRYLLRSEKLKSIFVNHYLFGLVIHIEMMLWMFTLPYPMSMTVINQTTVPILLMFPLATVLVIQMVTDQERKHILEKKLKSGSKRLENAQMISNIGHWEYYPAEEDLIISSNLLKILRIKDRSRITSFKDFRDYVADDYKSYLDAVFQESKDYKRPYNIEFQMRRDTGELIYVNEICQPEYNSSGEIAYIFGTIQNITEKKEAEVLLRASELSYRNLFTSMRDILLVIDSSFTLQKANPSFWNTFNYQKSEMKDSSVEVLFKEIDEYLELKKLTLAGRMKKDMIYSYKRANGSSFKGETRISAISEKDIDKPMFIISIRDITTQLYKDEKLEEYRANLEEKIEKRTKELQLANEGLIELNKSFTGREFRIKELKEENKKLKQLLEDSGIDYLKELLKLKNREI